MEITKEKMFEDIKKYNKIIFVFISSLLLFNCAAANNDAFVKAMSVTGYLTWHVIFEFASVLMSFSIFAVTYFVYEESSSLKMMILGSTFLAMGFLDAFHTLSFKGMADFFVANDSANRATTLWIISRLIGSIGFMLAAFIPMNRKSSIRKGAFAFITTAATILILIIVTYFPDFFPPMLIDGEGLTNLKIILEYVIIFIIGITFIMVTLEYQKTNLNSDYMFMIALLLSVFSEFAFTSYGSVYDAFNYLGHLYKVIAFIILYKSLFVENVSLPYKEMKIAKNELNEYSNNLNLIVQQRTKELEEMNNILLTDIENAREMQRSLLPIQMPQDISVSFHAEYLAAERLSGDFYNVIRLDEDNIAIYIGDVSGHGVSAAMLTVFANQNIKPLKEEGTYSEIIMEPGIVLKNTYKSFNNTNFNVETYLLMIYGIYNIKTKTFTYASAGINVPPYIIKKSGEIIEMDAKGFPICKLGEYMVPFYDDRKIKLEPGDKILFYSDGLIEAKNTNGEVYGQDKMKDFLSKNYGLSSRELNILIKNNLYNHIGYDGQLMDDATFLIMEVEG